MERPEVRIMRLCPIIVQSFFGRDLFTRIPFWNVSECQLLDLLWLRLLGNDFLTNLLACGIGHSTWPWNVRVCTWQACCPRLDKAWSSFSTEHTFSPRVPDQLRRVGSVIQPVRRAVPQLIPEGLGTIFHVAVARNVEHPFLRPPTTYVQSCGVCY